MASGALEGRFEDVSGLSDAHVHVERGPYTLEWIGRFAEAALERGIECVCLLEHSHRFREFAPLYEDIAAHSAYQAAWLSRKMTESLEDWAALVEKCRSIDWPIELLFGLEVCHVEGREDLVRGLTGRHDWDFLTGSIHWVGGWGFDHDADQWRNRDVDALWRNYRRAMLGLVDSGLYDLLAHPDSMKCFGFLPASDQSVEWALLARHAAAAGMAVEESAGLANNYKYPASGMEEGLLRALVAAKVPIVTASDAHRPEDLGRGVAQCAARAQAAGARLVRAHRRR